MKRRKTVATIRRYMDAVGDLIVWKKEVVGRVHCFTAPGTRRVMFASSSTPEAVAFLRGVAVGADALTEAATIINPKTGAELRVGARQAIAAGHKLAERSLNQPGADDDTFDALSGN